MSFDEWYRQLHATLLLHDETIKAFSRCRKRYEKQALADSNKIEVRVIAPDGSHFFRELALHPNGRWVWRSNLEHERLQN